MREWSDKLESACGAGLSASDARQYADGSARLMVEEEDGSDEEQFLRETEKQFTEEKP